MQRARKMASLVCPILKQFGREMDPRIFAEMYYFDDYGFRGKVDHLCRTLVKKLDEKGAEGGG